MKRDRLWLVCGAAATACASYWAMAGELEPPKGAVQPTMNSLADVFAAVQAMQGGGGGTPAACFAGFPGTTGLIGTLSITGLPGQGGDVESQVFSAESLLTITLPPTGGGGGGGGSAVANPLTLTKARDANTPRLFRGATQLQHYATATVRMTDSAGTEVFTYVLTDVVISGFKTTTVYRCDGTTVSADMVTLTSTKIRFTDVPTGNSWEWNSTTRTGSGT